MKAGKHQITTIEIGEQQINESMITKAPRSLRDY